MRKNNLFTMQALASVLILLLSACAEAPLGGNDKTGKGHTVTLHLAANAVPIPETKTSVQPASPGSEAAKEGFYYELVSSDATEKDSIFLPLATKAPATLKNVYALLFASDSTFNGRANIGTYTVGTTTNITFIDVVTPTATNCLLVLVANDDAAITSYASSGGTAGFESFSGNYADFRSLAITSAVVEDADVPYAGSATVDLSLNETDATINVPVYRTLAKITLNNTFNISDGPARSSITLYRAGERRFATPGSDNYDGTGATETNTYMTAPNSNTNSTTWYVGENICPAGTGILSTADRNSRNAPGRACFIEIRSASVPVPENTTPAIGEEYIPKGGGKEFTYDIYLGKSTDLSDFSLRRHTNYTITSEISGTLAEQKQLASEDGRVTFSGGAGLAIGRLGGPSGYTTGSGPTNTIAGSYTKLLLLEPNIARNTATDSVRIAWGAEGILYQPETRRFWDKSYIYSINTNGTVGGMSTATDSPYTYCNELTLGGVPKGTWYVPTLVQLQMIYTIYGGLKEGGFEDYAALNTFYYWASTEHSATNAWNVNFSSGYVPGINKAHLLMMRCVRDLSVSGISGQKVITNHPLANGYPVIDLSELSPLGCLLTASEAARRRTLINEQIPSNSESLGAGGDVCNQNGSWNAKMSPQFQVMRTNHTVGKTDWANAYNLCEQYNGEGGNAGEWRLPTQRELMVLWGLHPQLLLLGKDSFTAFSSNQYWSSTESNSTAAWYLIFNTGDVNSYRVKTSTYSVRCIRDI